MKGVRVRGLVSPVYGASAEAVAIDPDGGSHDKRFQRGEGSEG